MNGKKILPITASCFTELHKNVVAKCMPLPIVCASLRILAGSQTLGAPHKGTHTSIDLFLMTHQSIRPFDNGSLLIANDPHNYCTWHGA